MCIPLTLLDTGVRSSELVSIELCDILFDEGRVRVLQGKGRKQRWTAISEVALAALRTYLDDFRGRKICRPRNPSCSACVISEFAQFLDSFGTSVIDRLGQAYGEPSGIVRRGEERRDPRLILHQDEPTLRLNIQLSGNGTFTHMHEFEIAQVSVPPTHYEDLPIVDALDEDDERNFFHHSFRRLEAWAIEQTFVELPPQSFYLPAARSGIAQGHKVLAGSLVRQSRRIGLEPVNIPTLPGITTEFLSHMIGLISE